MPRKLPFDAVGSLRQLVEGMVPGEELVLTVQGEPKAIVTSPPQTSWPCQPERPRTRNTGWPRTLMHPSKTSRSTWNEVADGPLTLSLSREGRGDLIQTA